MGQTLTPTLYTILEPATLQRSQGRPSHACMAAKH